MEYRQQRRRIMILFIILQICNTTLYTIDSFKDNYGRRLLNYERLQDKKIIKDLFKENLLYYEVFLIIKKHINCGNISLDKKENSHIYNINYKRDVVWIYFDKENSIPSLKVYKSKNRPLVYGMIIIKINNIKKYELRLHCVNNPEISDITLEEYSVESTGTPIKIIDYYHDNKLFRVIKD